MSPTLPPPRHRDVTSKVFGEQPYTLDRTPPGTLYARLLRARGPHSQVTVDRERLLARPGVLAVLSPEDDPGLPFSANPHGAARDDMRVFTGEARFRGDIVGAVVARSREQARAAVQAARIHETPLPAVLSAAEALADGAPPAHRGFAEEGNLLAQLAFGVEEEEIRRALRHSDRVFDHTFHTEATAHSFLEPLTSSAEFKDNGHCWVRSTTQCPGLSRSLLARLLGVSKESITYEPVSIGGSFGGKEEFTLDAVAALCSRAAGGHPVVVETDRREMTAHFRVRHPAQIRVITGCDTAGRITARRLHALFTGGPYAIHTPSVAANGLSLAMSLYPVAATRATGTCVALNHVPGGAYRGYGAPQVLFAVEAQLDEIATSLDIDPLDLRELNALQPGAVDPAHGWPAHSFDLPSCLDEARSLPPLDRRTTGPRLRRGRGVAALANLSGLTGIIGVDRAEARCTVRAGRLTISTGAPDVGQGLHAALATAAAGELGVTEALVDVHVDAKIRDAGIYASRGAYLSANAVALAARDLRAQLPPGHLLPDAVVLPRAWEGHSGTGTFEAPDNALTAGVQVVDVEVDRETGQVRVLQVVSVHDAGRLLDPANARQQVVGGVVQALGLALSERLPYSAEGVPYDGTLLGLGVPSGGRFGEIRAVFTEGRHPEGPLGVKGLGESPVMAVAPALASAIHAAVGVRLRTAPFTPERVWTALRAARPLAEASTPPAAAEVLVTPHRDTEHRT